MTMKKICFGALALVGLAQAGFDPCKFNFGESWEGPNSSYAAQTDYVTIWIGDGGGKNEYNTYWEGDMLRKCKAGSGHAIAGKTPVFYSYMIAFLARNKGGLKDCDVAGMNASNSLCVNGAKYIKENRALILQKYDEFSKGAAKDYGTTSPIIWLLEPDILQYHEATSYWGTQTDPLSLAEMKSLVNDIVAKIKTNMPNAKISFDISPWLGGTDWQAAHTEWWNNVASAGFAYRNTSGGRTQGNNARIRSDANNLTTWAGIKSISKLPIIADDGYGVGGASNSDWYEWVDAANLNARIADGVVALSIQKPASDYNSKIAAVRPLLNKTSCGTGPVASQFTIATTATNGTIALSPATGPYDSNSVVTAMAAPSAGYKFTGWSGACTGTGACSITMNANKSLTASFAAVPKYALTTSATNGTIALSPTGGSYDSNTVVTATATPTSGYRFTGWTGACTGTGTCKVTMNAAKTLGATFVATPKYTLAVEAGNGTIALSPTGGSYDSNTVVTATATAPAGYELSAWTGACTGTGACKITMNANKTLGATWSLIPPNKYVLTVNAGAGGSVVRTPDSVSYSSGTKVVLRARPDSVHTFGGWSGACTGTDTVCTVTMDAAKTVSASFSGQTLYSLSLNATNGTITTSPAGPKFAVGSKVVLTAKPASGFVFAAWYNSCDSLSGNTCTITVPNYDGFWVGAGFNAAPLGIAGRLPNGERLLMIQGALSFDATGLGSSRLVVTDLQGRASVLWQGQMNNAHQISLQGMKPGVYHVRLEGESGRFSKLVQILH